MSHVISIICNHLIKQSGEPHFKTFHINLKTVMHAKYETTVIQLFIRDVPNTSGIRRIQTPYVPKKRPLNVTIELLTLLSTGEISGCIPSRRSAIHANVAHDFSQSLQEKIGESIPKQATTTSLNVHRLSYHSTPHNLGS